MDNELCKVIPYLHSCLVTNIDKESLEELPEYTEAVMKHVEPDTHNNPKYYLFHLSRCMCQAILQLF